MRRRQYLALLASVGAAGCTSGTGGDDDRTDTETDPRKTDLSATPGESPTEAEPFPTVQLGSRDDVTDTEDNRPHHVRVDNEGPARDVAVRIDRAPADSDVVKTLFSETLGFPPDGRLGVELLEPARYVVSVDVPASGQETSFVVDADWFDCNYSAHDVTVPAQGAIEVTAISTLVACEVDDGTDTETG